MPAVPQGSHLDAVLQRAPEVAGRVAQVIVDNPAPLALTAAGAMVATRILANAMKPRGLLEFAALWLTCNALCSWGTTELIERGILKFRVRDADGKLIPLVISGKAELLFHHGADCPGHTAGPPGEHCAEYPGDPVPR